MHPVGGSSIKTEVLHFTILMLHAPGTVIKLSALLKCFLGV